MNILPLIRIYENAPVVWSGDFQTTVNELTDQLPKLRFSVLQLAIEALLSFGPILGDVILSEEDKGGLFAGALSFASGVDLAMAREYKYFIPSSLGSVEVNLSMEYGQGTLKVHGIQAGMHVTIIDDTLSTGGTLLSLIRAVESVGAEVVDIRVLVEKLDNGGRARIKIETGLDVQAVLGIRIDGEGKVHVVETFGQPRRTL